MKTKIKKFLIKSLIVICVLLVVSSIVAYGEIKLALYLENLIPVYLIADVNVPKKELSVKDYVLKEFAKANIDIKTAEAVINCESRWKTDAININSNKTYDAGIFQINSIHKDISLQDKLNYKTAVKWAINKVKRDGGFQAWQCSKLIAKN